MKYSLLLVLIFATVTMAYVQRANLPSAALIAAKEGADLILAPNGRVADAVRGKISVPVFASPRNGWAGVGARDAA